MKMKTCALLCVTAIVQLQQLPVHAAFRSRSPGQSHRPASMSRGATTTSQLNADALPFRPQHAGNQTPPGYTPQHNSFVQGFQPASTNDLLQLAWQSDEDNLYSGQRGSQQKPSIWDKPSKQNPIVEGLQHLLNSGNQTPLGYMPQHDSIVQAFQPAPTNDLLQLAWQSDEDNLYDVPIDDHSPGTGVLPYASNTNLQGPSRLRPASQSKPKSTDWLTNKINSRLPPRLRPASKSNPTAPPNPDANRGSPSNMRKHNLRSFEELVKYLDKTYGQGGKPLLVVIFPPPVDLEGGVVYTVDGGSEPHMRGKLCRLERSLAGEHKVAVTVLENGQHLTCDDLYLIKMVKANVRGAILSVGMFAATTDSQLLYGSTNRTPA